MVWLEYSSQKPQYLLNVWEWVDFPEIFNLYLSYKGLFYIHISLFCKEIYLTCSSWPSWGQGQRRGAEEGCGEGPGGGSHEGEESPDGACCSSVDLSPSGVLDCQASAN